MKAAWLSGWGPAGVPAAQITQAVAELGIDTALVAVSFANGGAQLTITNAPAGVDLIVYAVPPAIATSPGHVPDYIDAEATLDYLALHKNVVGVVAVHEIEWPTPEDLAYFAWFCNAARARDIEPIAIISLDAAGQRFPRASGMSVLTQVYTSYCAGGGVWSWRLGGTDPEHAAALVKIALETGSLATYGPAGKMDGIMFEAVGVDAGPPFLASEWETPSIAKAKTMLGLLAGFENKVCYWHYWPDPGGRWSCLQNHPELMSDYKQWQEAVAAVTVAPRFRGRNARYTRPTSHYALE